MLNSFLNFISDIRVVISIAALVLVLAIWLIVQRVRSRSYKSDLKDLESRYKDVKNVPVQEKMDQAAAIAKHDEEAKTQVTAVQQDLEKTQANLKIISETLADAEDSILIGKLGKADNLMSDLEKDISSSEKQMKDLDSKLDSILQRQTQERQEITVLKNRFRALKSQAEENAKKLSFAWPNVEQKLLGIEKMFTTFEEWMYSNDVDKAEKELETIKLALGDLDNVVENLPDLMEKASGYLPKLAETLNADYSTNKDKGVYLKHLEVGRNLNMVTTSLRYDLHKLKNCEMDGVSRNLEDYEKRLKQLDEAVLAEGKAFDEKKEILTRINDLDSETEKISEQVQKEYSENAEKFGLKSREKDLNDAVAAFAKLQGDKDRIIANAQDEEVPSTSSVVALKEFEQGLTVCHDSLSKLQSDIGAACGDEDRAKKQIVKLQIVMNQMQVKIRKYKLPNISEQYHDDMKKAQKYIDDLNDLVNEKPLNMQLLNENLQTSLDFIYKLYNNVNNVVGTVVMVENTIVFGNRYRSTYADIDSELTRSELSFRNGEYTQALTIAIATIEKIHPGNYESMIKENAKSAA